MEVDLRSLVLRSECVFAGVGVMTGCVDDEQAGFHLMFVEARYHSWMLDPWW